jgi:dTDP-glucose 4,6-dehydratase
MTTLLITGGAGFIGSNLVRMLARQGQYNVIILDALTYAGNLENLDGVIDGSAVKFVHGSITDVDCLAKLFAENTIDAVLHLAAESHVDRSIASAAPFVETNVPARCVFSKRLVPLR